MFQGIHGHYDAGDDVWCRGWYQPPREEHRIREIFTIIRDQTVYRKLAGDQIPIGIEQLIRASGLNVGRWMDRYDAALQTLANNAWIVYYGRGTKRGQYVADTFYQNEHTQVDAWRSNTELSYHALKKTNLPKVDEVIASLDRGGLQ